jgi:hypothetical protein
MGERRSAGERTALACASQVVLGRAVERGALRTLASGSPTRLVLAPTESEVLWWKARQRECGQSKECRTYLKRDGCAFSLAVDAIMAVAIAINLAVPVRPAIGRDVLVVVVVAADRLTLALPTSSSATTSFLAATSQPALHPPATGATLPPSSCFTCSPPSTLTRPRAQHRHNIPVLPMRIELSARRRLSLLPGPRVHLAGANGPVVFEDRFERREAVRDGEEV